MLGSERKQAAAVWKKLIPSGELPPQEKDTPKKKTKDDTKKKKE